MEEGPGRTGNKMFVIFEVKKPYDLICSMILVDFHKLSLNRYSLPPKSSTSPAAFCRFFYN